MKPSTRNTAFRIAGVAALAGFGAPSAFMLLMTMNVSSGGGPDPFIAGFLEGVMAVAAAGMLVFGAMALSRPASRRTGGFAILGGAVFFVACAGACICLPSPVSIRREAFRKLGERLAPLVDAIERYRAEKGTCPKDLDELVPGYLPALPATGMPSYPDYAYLEGTAAAKYDSNPYVIDIDAHWGLGFDRFLYFPKQNYPEDGYGGTVERLGRWAYVWE